MFWQDGPFPFGLTGRDSPLRIANTVAIREHQGYPWLADVRHHDSKYPEVLWSSCLNIFGLGCKHIVMELVMSHEYCMSIDTWSMTRTLNGAYDRLCRTADFTSRIHVNCVGIHTPL